MAPMDFSKTLIKWYLPQKRDLPWRKTIDPYKIWLSEIMLQQTRVEQGLPYYEVFLKNFPTVFDLARASEEKVLKLWQGLGYYSRARNLHSTAKYLAKEKNGEFPKTASELLKLKGVGEYTAAAIASICFREPVAVVDGNVFRALSRIFGIATPINSTEGKKEFKALATKILDPKNPATHNQALMEFGALHCKPVRPLCESCLFQRSCTAFQAGKTKEFPVKLKKSKSSTRHFNYLVFHLKDNVTLLKKRTEKGIWRNLYEFPLIETTEEQSLEKFLKHPKMQALCAEKIRLYNEKSIKHVLSHQKLLVKFWIVSGEKFPEELAENSLRVACSKLQNFPMPVLMEKYLKNLFRLEASVFSEKYSS